MYPYQRTPMGNPYISPIARGYLWVSSSPRIPREHNKYHGYTVRGTPICPLNKTWKCSFRVRVLQQSNSLKTKRPRKHQRKEGKTEIRKGWRFFNLLLYWRCVLKIIDWRTYKSHSGFLLYFHQALLRLVCQIFFRVYFAEVSHCSSPIKWDVVLSKSRAFLLFVFSALTFWCSFLECMTFCRQAFSKEGTLSEFPARWSQLGYNFLNRVSRTPLGLDILM